MPTTVTPLDKAVDHFRRGGFVALLDSANREDEADLLQAAQYVSGESINFMLTYARGLITVAMAPQRLTDLQIPVLEPQFGIENMPRFTMPVDYTPAVTTGVSAFDRAATIRALADGDTRPEDFARPGHVFPLAAAPKGLAERAGHTEGAVGLAQLAGSPALCRSMHQRFTTRTAGLCSRICSSLCLFICLVLLPRAPAKRLSF